MVLRVVHLVLDLEVSQVPASLVEVLPEVSLVQARKVPA